MFHRPVTALWGIGPRMAENLAELEISTVAELASADPARLEARFGATMGPYYWRLGFGDGGTTVDPEPREPRGRSRSETYPDDLTDWDDVKAHVSKKKVLNGARRTVTPTRPPDACVRAARISDQGTK